MRSNFGAKRYFGLASGCSRLRLQAVDGAAFDSWCRPPHPGGHDAIFLDASTSSGDTAPPPALSSRAALRRLRQMLRVGGALIINVLGSARHVDEVEARVFAAFASVDEVRRISTNEGNVVLAALRGGQGACSRSGADELVWREACAAVGLRARGED